MTGSMAIHKGLSKHINKRNYKAVIKHHGVPQEKSQPRGSFKAMLGSELGKPAGSVTCIKCTSEYGSEPHARISHAVTPHAQTSDFSLTT